MKFKNTLGILAISAVAMTTVSCSEDTMDRINKDNGHPSAEFVDAKFQLTDAIVSSVFTTNGGSFAWYVSSYTEQLFGCGNNQLKNAELRNANETAASATFNNEWDGTYLSLNNIQQMITKCESGANAGQADILGMAQILAAYDWGIMTDMFGNIPCSEAFKASAPKVDSQESIYENINNLLDAAIVNLGKAIDGKMKNAGSQDLLFNGNCSKWRGLAHALKARYLLHKAGRVDDKNTLYTQVLSETDAAIADGFDGALLDVFTGYGAGQTNSWSAYWASREYIASSKTVEDLLIERNDPREPLYNNNEFGTNTIGEPGNEEQAQSIEELNVPAWLDYGFKNKQGSHMFSKSELYFIRAEVKTRLGQDAKADFETAVKASLEDYATSCGETFSNDEVAAYLSGVTATKFAANPLSEILVQKYIAQTRDEQLETFNDIRRCKYVDGSYPVALTNPKNNSSIGNRLPLRLPYGSSDVLSNPNVKEAFGSGNDAGMYIFTENVWWAGGSR